MSNIHLMYKIIKVSDDNNPYTLTLKGETIERRNIESLLCGSIQEIPGMLEDTVLVVIRDARKQKLKVNLRATSLVRSDFTDAVYGPAILLKVKGGNFCGLEEGQAGRIVNTLLVGDKL